VLSLAETDEGTVATTTVADNPNAISLIDTTGTDVPGNYTVRYVNGALTMRPTTALPVAMVQVAELPSATVAREGVPPVLITTTPATTSFVAPVRPRKQDRN
jgi:hypothetical protein